MLTFAEDNKSVLYILIMFTFGKGEHTLPNQTFENMNGFSVCPAGKLDQLLQSVKIAFS